MYCMMCGQEIPDDSKVCGYCGKKVPLQAAAPSTPAQIKPSKAKPSPASDPAPAAKPTKAVKPAEPTMPTRSAQRKFPLWGWIAIGAGVIVVALILIFSLGGKPTTVLQLVGGCQTTFYVQANERLELHYGHWGVIGADFIEQNDAAMDIRLTINGTQYQGRRANPLGLSELPCVEREDFSDAEWNESQYLHDEVTVSLDPGTYDVLFVVSLDDEISDGFDSDNEGSLDVYGPGEIFRREYTIVVRE